MHKIKMTNEEFAKWSALKDSGWKTARKGNCNKLPPKKKFYGEERIRLLTPCLACGYSNLKAICLHHVNRHKFPELVISLCTNCHTIYHKTFGNSAVADSALDVLKSIKK